MVDIRSEVNRELVMRFVSDVASGNRFYSDLNGFQVFTPLFVSFYFDMLLNVQSDASLSVMSHSDKTVKLFIDHL